MSRPLFTNNAASALAQAITPIDTILKLTPGTGSYFPQPTIGDYFMLTLVQINNPEVSEIVECIDRVGDTLTVVRGQEGTQPQIFNLSDNVELRITAGSLNLFAIGGGGGGSASGTSVADYTATQGQTVFTLPWSYTQGIDNLAIFINGSKQVVNVNYTESTTTSFTMASGLNAGDIVQAIYNLPLAGGIIDASNVIYNEGSTGAINSTVKTKLQESVSVKDFGADSTGSSDSSTAFQNAINSLASFGGCLHIPSGTYKLNSVVTYSGKSLQIIGDGIETTQILVNNSNGAFDLTFTTTTVTFDFLTFSNLSIVATGSLNNGTALKATWPNPGLLASSPETIIENIYIRSNVYTVNTASTPYFTNGIYLVNVANSRIQNSFISQIGNQLSKGINIDNSAATSAFFLKVDGVTIEGNQYGIYQQGWMEAYHIVNCEIAAPEYGIYFNNNTATALLPQMTIEKLHVNAIKKCIYFNNFQDILIDGVNLLMANESRNTTATQINAIELNACKYIRISNSLITTATAASPGVATSCNAILFTNCLAVLVTANQFQTEIGGSITSGNSIGVNVSTSSNVVKIVDNQFRAQSGTSAKYIYVNPALYSNERIETYNNQFNDGLVGIEYKDVSNGSINNNQFDAIGTPVSITGTTVPNSNALYIYDNTPRVNQTLTVNSATPSVGSALNTWFAATNTSATTITNFLNGYDGQVINIYFSNSNTTVQANSNVFTYNGSNFTGTAGSLMSLTFIYGVWRTTMQKA